MQFNMTAGSWLLLAGWLAAMLGFATKWTGWDQLGALGLWGSGWWW
ncbi:MAG: hypothetical protein KKB50_01785 [Planctomycetes bacterium]|nr:hypothetical protein [Planctomycetota bacterium]